MMALRFLWKAAVPGLTLTVITTVLTALRNNYTLVILLIGMPLTAIWVFLTITGGNPYLPQKPAKEAETQSSFAMPRIIAYTLIWFASLGALLLLVCVDPNSSEKKTPGAVPKSSEKAEGKPDLWVRTGEWELVGELAAILGFVSTVVVIIYANGYQSFVRAEASRAVRREYAKNQKLIKFDYPPSVMASELHGQDKDVSPEHAWRIAADILRHIHESVRRVSQERAAAEQERQRVAETERKTEESAREEKAKVLPHFTPPNEPEPEPIRAAPAAADTAESRQQFQRRRSAIQKAARDMDLPPEILHAELERLDEEFRKQFGDSQ
ncbi:MAG TPA: hypothetical protein VHR66_29980 [Gemmataceae bacterium]|jgi:hypothetical protein|nr:hypothetical protein [Gemmataceae bacterium]